MRQSWPSIFQHLLARSSGALPASHAASELRNVVDLREQTHFGTDDHPNQWIQYTFEEGRVKPKHDAIRSCLNGGPGYANPKSWIIEASNDGIT
jgi:hypothetical protein